MSFLLFYITHPDRATAERISGELVTQKLVACANCFPIESAYWWEGAVAQEGEWVSLVKTTLAKENKVEEYVQKVHPYTTPCILRMEVRANAAYEQWIQDSVEESQRT
ncbi:MAG: divalent-cation tolerance protein CutA [Bacteroidota bacterium]